MFFSKTSQVAIKAVSFLASRPEIGHPISLSDLASAISESQHTLGKTLQLLVKDGIIQSLKGPKGGFYMNISQLDLHVLHILTAVENKFEFNTCVLGVVKCGKHKPCALHYEFIKARAEVEKILIKTNIEQLINHSDKRSGIPDMYVHRQ